MQYAYLGKRGDAIPDLFADAFEQVRTFMMDELKAAFRDGFKKSCEMEQPNTMEGWQDKMNLARFYSDCFWDEREAKRWA